MWYVHPCNFSDSANAPTTVGAFAYPLFLPSASCYAESPYELTQQHMRDDLKHTFWDSWSRFKEGIIASLRTKVVIRQKFGGEVLAVPVLFAILLLVFAIKFVIIGTVVLLIAGYRMSFERR